MFPRSLWTVTHVAKRAVCTCTPISWKPSDHPYFHCESTAHHGLIKCRPSCPLYVRNYTQLPSTSLHNYESILLRRDTQLKSTAPLFHELVRPLFCKDNVSRSTTVSLKEPCRAWMTQRRFRTTATTKSVLKQGGLPGKRTVKGARTKQPSRANQPVPEEDPVGLNLCSNFPLQRKAFADWHLLILVICFIVCLCFDHCLTGCNAVHCFRNSRPIPFAHTLPRLNCQWFLWNYGPATRFV